MRERTHLALIDLCRRMIFPELAFWEIGDLLAQPLADSASDTLIEAQNV